MGNQSSSPSKKKKGTLSPSASQDEGHASQLAKSESRGMIRSPSGADFRDTSSSSFIPIEELAKILTKKNETEGTGSGICDHVFAKYVFPSHNNLGLRVFRHFHTQSHAKTTHLGTTAFKQQVERYMSVLDDQKVIEMFVRIFSGLNDENASKDGVKDLLRTSFEIAMTFNSGESHSCPNIESTLDTVIATCFFQESLSIGFIARWLEENCSRIILPIHRYVLHVLTTSYRKIQMNVEDKATGGLELTTPVLEMQGKQFQDDKNLLCLSTAWLLAGTLPQLYSRPQINPKANSLKDNDMEASNPMTSSSLLPSQAFLTKVVPVLPSHWTLIYDTMEHGVGANRFLHHVIGYKGPTLTLLRARSSKDNIEKLFCVASSTEWRETHLYVGGEESCLLQLTPKFSLMEKGGKILYLNTHIRGYPKGLRVATDPRNPIIAVDEYFENVDVHAMNHTLLSIEVWGCGDKSSRDVQLDIKKWQVKEAERQRTVKLTASDWLDHPDRYLLEMGGRPTYNNSKE